MNDCKHEFELKYTEKLTDYRDSRIFIKNMGRPIKGELINREFCGYMIFCKKCGWLERKGEI